MRRVEQHAICMVNVLSPRPYFPPHWWITCMTGAISFALKKITMPHSMKIWHRERGEGLF
jgi:hypothetical protein